MPGAYGYGWDAANSVWRKILVNADGKLIIDPTEIFEDVPTDNEHGKAPTSDWAYSVAGNPYWSCVGARFDPQYPATDDIEKVGYGYVIVHSGTVRLYTYVSLPNGYTVSDVIVYGNTAAESVDWYFEKVELATNTYTQLARAAVNTEANISPGEVLDNQTYGYYIHVADLTANMEIWGARIRFTI